MVKEGVSLNILVVHLHLDDTGSTPLFLAAISHVIVQFLIKMFSLVFVMWLLKGFILGFLSFLGLFPSVKTRCSGEKCAFSSRNFNDKRT